MASDQTSPDADNCALCDGRGEIEATTKRLERDVVGCPLCIQTAKDELIERLRARLAIVDKFMTPIPFERGADIMPQAKVSLYDRMREALADAD